MFLTREATSHLYLQLSIVHAIVFSLQAILNPCCCSFCRSAAVRAALLSRQDHPARRPHLDLAVLHPKPVPDLCPERGQRRRSSHGADQEDVGLRFDFTAEGCIRVGLLSGEPGRHGFMPFQIRKHVLPLLLQRFLSFFKSF